MTRFKERGQRQLAFLLGLSLLAFGARADGALIEQGRRIYQQGIQSDGQPLSAVSAGSASLGAERAACIACHRRSGMGSREGAQAVSPITGPILFARPVSSLPKRPGREAKVTPLRRDSRSAYDDSTLVRALREGLDPDGRHLTSLMPRYKLADADAKALTAYLRQLSAAPVPGLQGAKMHLATIVTADADPVRSKVVSETLTTWARMGGLRGVPMDLQVWKLDGPAATWGQQLQEYNRRQPVYAVLSGAGGGQWAPVRDFCEQAALPCLFPIVDLAPSAPDDFYTLYFSRGVPLEAQMLARHINELTPRPKRVVQIVAGDAGVAAARLLDADLGELPHETRSWKSEAPASLIADLLPGDVLVAWLGSADLRRLARAQPKGPGTPQAYFSAQLAPPDQTELPLAWRKNVRWVSAHSDPERLFGKGVIGLTPWAEHMHLPLDERSLMSQIYAATYYFADALARMRGSWNREYLLETMENADFDRPAGSAYVSLSLAPGQREAAKGGHLLGFAKPDFAQVVIFGDRLTP